MDGENNGKPYWNILKWRIWGENPLFSETSICPSKTSAAIISQRIPILFHCFDQWISEIKKSCLADFLKSFKCFFPFAPLCNCGDREMRWCFFWKDEINQLSLEGPSRQQNLKMGGLHIWENNDPLLEAKTNIAEKKRTSHVYLFLRRALRNFACDAKFNPSILNNKSTTTTLKKHEYMNIWHVFWFFWVSGVFSPTATATVKHCIPRGITGLLVQQRCNSIDHLEV